uniref:NADH-ubiquinone oxidoreductase chain 5 n=1 Tax=Rhipiphorothrips cruentatus TaxID=764491 RepID=A0A8A5L5F9_9NEOP|nr:NADH dehydrogenase subunit 5 [Rhipiphorothrips cruentatus]
MFLLMSLWFIFSLKIIFLDWELMSVGSLKFNFPIYLDYMTILFIFLVILISFLIIIYSYSYMQDDMYKWRFMFILTLFVVSMIFFLISPNLVSMLLGWDGLGLVSYCLVIHYQNFKSNCSGLLTALSNRIGDCFLILSICFFMNYGCWNYLFLIEDLKMSLVFLLIFCAITKSAQIPFSSWLPAAMAAPTPVSSLVHSSTLVTAGVYLLIRFSNYLFFNSMCLNFVVNLGCLTTLMAGLCALFEMDLKKIVALSTLSQLGLMMSGFILCSKDLVFFHLFMHALFKASMFMCVGNFIHMNLNCQDLRFYGNLGVLSPLIIIYFSVSNLCLCGLPFLCGFFSKDLILEMLFLNQYNFFLLILFFLGVMLTIMYTFRVLFFVLSLSLNLYSSFLNFDKNKYMIFSIFFLYLSSIFFGYFYSSIVLVPMNLIVLPLYLKLLVLFISIFSLFFFFFVLNSNWSNFFKSVMKIKILEFFESMFFLSFISKNFGLIFFFNLSSQMNNLFSNGWIELGLGSKMMGMIYKNFLFSELKLKLNILNWIMGFLYFFLVLFFVFWWVL